MRSALTGAWIILAALLLGYVLGTLATGFLEVALMPRFAVSCDFMGGCGR